MGSRARGLESEGAELFVVKSSKSNCGWQSADYVCMSVTSIVVVAFTYCTSLSLEMSEIYLLHYLTHKLRDTSKYFLCT